METQNKLKPGTSPVIAAIAAVIVILIIAAVLKSNFGGEVKNDIFGIAWGLITVGQIIFWFKTRNPGYFTFSIIAAAMSFSLITDYKGIYFVVPFILLVVVHFYFMASRQMKWRFRDVLEKAAQPVNETKDGFTSRPMPAGKVNFTREKFSDFGKFLAKNLIAFPIEFKDNYFLLIKNANGLWFQNPNSERDSYISFDEDGNVSVNISIRDYLKFKEELTFDQLNVSLARMFIEFWELYENGDEKKILDHLDSKISEKMMEGSK